jgi:hypothetical protein
MRHFHVPASYRSAACRGAALLALLLAPAAPALPQGGAGNPPPAAGTPPAGPSGAQPPAGALPFFQQPNLPEQRQVHITGENPGLQLRQTANGPITADFNFWRVAWSPAGTGHICYLTTGDGTGPGDLRIALTDNPALVPFVSDETMAKLVPGFNEPKFKVIPATIRSEGDTLGERSEICESEQYKLRATWRKITPGQFSGMKPGNGFTMTFIVSLAAEGELWVNGERLAGQVLPGPGRPPAYLAFAETWLK